MAQTASKPTFRLSQVLIVVGVIMGITALLIVKGMTERTVQVDLLPEEQLEQALASGQPAAVFFHSTNCESCMQMIETVGEVHPQFAEAVVLVDVNVSETYNHAFLREQGIRLIPTMVFYDQGGHAEIVYGAMTPELMQAYFQYLSERQ